MVDTPMPLTAHLTELRGRLFACVIAIGIGFLLCYGLSDYIIAALQSPPSLLGPQLTVPLQIIAPARGESTAMMAASLFEQASGLDRMLPIDPRAGRVPD